MPSKTKLKNAAIAARSAALPKIPQELLDQLVQGPMTAESIQDVTSALKKALIERALGGELSHHLGYPPGGDKPAEAGNHRNGSTGKTVLTEGGPLRIEVPRDRRFHCSAINCQRVHKLHANQAGSLGQGDVWC